MRAEARLASTRLCPPERSYQLAISQLLVGWQIVQHVYCYRRRRLPLSVKGRKDVFTSGVRQRPRDGGLELLGYRGAALHLRSPSQPPWQDHHRTPILGVLQRD